MAINNNSPLEDYYEVLQVSPNADTETISRVFRHMAKQLHPDNRLTGDPVRFDLLVRAHRVLTDPEQREVYDARHRERWAERWRMGEEEGAAGRPVDAFAQERRLRSRLLSLFYVKRRRELSSPGLGVMELGRLLDCPTDVVEFHVWYMQEKKWLVRMETGQFAITAEGVDQVEQNDLELHPDHLLPTNASRDSAKTQATGAPAADPEHPPASPSTPSQ